jgi:hypothetical protein
MGPLVDPIVKVSVELRLGGLAVAYNAPNDALRAFGCRAWCVMMLSSR